LQYYFGDKDLPRSRFQKFRKQKKMKDVSVKLSV